MKKQLIVLLNMYLLKNTKKLEEYTRDMDSETDENRLSKMTKFYEQLSNLIKRDSTKYSNLLKNIPTIVNVDQGEVTRYPLDKPEQEHPFLLKFLRAGNYDIDVAIAILINYIVLMRDHPKYYKNSLDLDFMQNVINEKMQTVLLHRDKFGRRVFIQLLGKWNPDSVSFSDSYCAMYMMSEMIALEPLTQIAGCTLVCDGSNMRLEQLTKLSLEDIRNSAKFIQVDI